MLWTPKKTFREFPFEKENELEAAVLEVANALFGESRFYLDVKKKIGGAGRKNNIPDGYLLDLSSGRDPKLYVVENELARHEPLRHIAVQVLEFSLSFNNDPQKVREILRTAIMASPDILEKCRRHAKNHGFENVDYLLDRMISGRDRFNAMVIIDELNEELETALTTQFAFPVETLTLMRYVGPEPEKEIVYSFDPFLAELVPDFALPDVRQAAAVDLADIDTIVVPAHAGGFAETFLGENRWYAIRIHSSMKQHIKHIAAYQVAPISAITHVAEVKAIERWPESNKYVVNFDKPARSIGPLRLVPNGKISPLYGPRYTSLAKLERATTLDEAF